MNGESLQRIPKEAREFSPPEGIRPEKYIVSQFELDFPAPINKTACGLANLVSATSLASGEISDNPESEIADFIAFDRRSTPHIYVRFASHPEIEFPVKQLQVNQPTNPQVNQAQGLLERLSKGASQTKFEVYVKETADKIYRPTFSVQQGTDARGALEWLESQGYQVALIEYNPKTDYRPRQEHHHIITNRGDFLAAYYTLISEKPYKFKGQEIKPNHRMSLMTSVRQARLGYPLNIKYISDPDLPSTHQVLTIPHPTEKQVFFLDPAMTSSEQKVFSRPREEFNKAFCPEDTTRAHFTVVWK